MRTLAHAGARDTPQLARLRADTGLKMPDCCVLLAAEHTAARVASFDEQLIKAASARHLDTVTD